MCWLLAVGCCQLRLLVGFQAVKDKIPRTSMAGFFNFFPNLFRREVHRLLFIGFHIEWC